MNRVCELRAEEHGIPSPRVSLDRGIRYGGYAGRRNEIYVNLEACLDSEKIFDTVVDEVENSYRLQCRENEPQELSEEKSSFYGYFIAQSAFIIETPSITMVFDCHQPDKIPQLSKDKPIVVFISHTHADHFNRGIFALSEKYTDVTYFVGYDVGNRFIDSCSEQVKKCIHFFNDYQKQTTEWGEIMSLKSTDIGVAYIVEVDGRVFFHAGDLAIWNADVDRQMFTMIVKHMEGMHIDYAMIPLDNRCVNMGNLTVQTYMEMLDIDYFTPMHMWDNYAEVDAFANKFPQFVPKMIAMQTSASVKKVIKIGEYYEMPFKDLARKEDHLKGCDDAKDRLLSLPETTEKQFDISGGNNVSGDISIEILVNAPAVPSNQSFSTRPGRRSITLNYKTLVDVKKAVHYDRLKLAKENPDAVANAIDSYAAGIKPETVLAIEETAKKSFFRQYSEGILFTEKLICSSHFADRKKIYYDEIIFVGLFGDDVKIRLANGEVIIADFGVSNMNVVAVLKAIVEK